MVSRQELRLSVCLMLLISLLAACQPAKEVKVPARSPTPEPTVKTRQNPTGTSKVGTEIVPLPMATSQTMSNPGLWKTLPVLPELSSRAREIYTLGQEMGINPRAFSKVGDGEIATNWFLTVFEDGSEAYELGEYAELSVVIEAFKGSYTRRSLAALPGFNTSRILDPLFAPNDICEVEESPLECELRQHRPSFAFISLGTNQIWTPEVFEVELRQMVEICIEHGVIPILATKGDNLEGDHRINAIIAEVAYEFDVPLWNFWLSIQSLPSQGLQPDGEHLTWADNDFSDPEAMQHAWPVRNLTALQLLDGLMSALAQY